MALLTVACSPVESYPDLDTQGLESVISQLEKPATLAKLSLRSRDHLTEDESVMKLDLRSFPNVSEDCQAIAELDNFARYAELGNTVRTHLPAPLGSFDHIAGMEWRLQDTNQVDRGDYGVIEEIVWSGVAVALLSFESAEDALAYSAQIRDNIEPCFNFVLDYSRYELDEVTLTQEDTKDFGFSATYLYEDPDWGLAYNRTFQINHFGSTLMIASATSDQYSQELLGVSHDELKAGLLELPALVSDAILQPQ